MEHLIGRQPIFNHKDVVVGYEIVTNFDPSLFLSLGAEEKRLPKQVLDSILNGEDTAFNKDHALFLNVTPTMLLDEEIFKLSTKKVILQLTEQAPPTDEMMAAMAKLKDYGYKLAFDAFTLLDAYKPYTKFMDYVSLDFSTSMQSARRLVPLWAEREKAKTIAYNVHTRADQSSAKELGYELFHGNYIYEPVFTEKEEIPAFKFNYMRLLQAINKEEVTFDELDQIIKQEVSLTYRLLKYINSAGFGLRNKIESISHALTMLGVKEIKKWATMASINSMGDDLPDEALITCVLRGRFLENLAPLIHQANRKDDLFFMGIFSMIELFFSRPMEEVLKELPINDDVKDALLGKPGEFTTLLNMVKAYDDGDWDPLHEHLKEMNIDEEKIPEIYFDTLDWAQNIFMSAK